ncbi:MAG: hypothetical protein K6U88_16515 [Dehalococcoidia bacterium]|nr:hypothetical protein [Dehalococcoidia bacterium]
MGRFQLISADSHVVEPANLWLDYIDPRFRDRAPRIVEPEPGVQGWEWEGRFYPLSFQGNAHTRRFREGEEGRGDDLYARRYDNMIPAAYDVHERVDEVVGLFREFVARARAVRRLGSAALDLCYVAAGRLDGFWEARLNPWDTCAGALVVLEAGGTVTAWDGTPYHSRVPGLVATNGRLHAAMLDVIDDYTRRAAKRTP